MAKDETMLSPKLDIVFKMLFGNENNKDILKAFLSDMLDIPEEKMHNIRIKNPEIEPTSINEKYYRLDLNLDIGDQLVNIEMQVRAEKYYPDRTLLYWSKLYSSQLEEGEPYSKLCPCISINILDFVLFGEHEDVHSEFSVWDVEHNKKLSDKMQIHFFELKKVKDGIDKGNRKNLWLQFIKSTKKEEFEMLRTAEMSALDRAIDDLYNMNNNEKLKELARMREKAMHDKASELEEAIQTGEERGLAKGIAKGRAEGEARGEAKKEAEMLDKMKKFGLSDEDIKKIFNIKLRK